MKKIQLLIALIFCIYLMPNIGMACGNTHVGTADIEANQATEQQHESCCKSHESSDVEDTTCCGQCGHSTCTCSATSSTSTFTLVAMTFFDPSITYFFALKKTNFNYLSKSISDGFLSIWLIPKIG